MSISNFRAIARSCDRPDQVCTFCTSSCLLYADGCSIPDSIDIDFHISYFIGNWALGIGNGAWGMGHGAWGRLDAWTLGLEKELLPITHYPLPITHSPFPVQKALQYMK
ncbi:hypothetical protein PI95_006730 [Hassallia byssoidea VB512170]|uniref:Uncharacterized protein n=1 Tax=Hassallia byssoidea VB512170 TaxID=1304833 RepID=A0A846H6I0_9CYAN|nr:hypothetical protein [Hassalia byssoidea]NEU72274.1 hypothetical protein [Hassalia byssoidea VB512170]